MVLLRNDIIHGKNRGYKGVERLIAEKSPRANSVPMNSCLVETDSALKDDLDHTVDQSQMPRLLDLVLLDSAARFQESALA